MIASPFAVFFLAAFAQESFPVQAPKSLVLVDLETSPLSLAELQLLDFDILARRDASLLELLCDERDQARLAELGLSFEVEHADLSEFYAARARADAALPPPLRGGWLSPPFGQGSMGGYYTFAELQSVLDQIRAAFPGIVTAKSSIGSSIEGRPIWSVKVSDNPTVDENEPEVRFDALHHAREPESMQALIWAMLALVEDYGIDPLATYLVNEREIWFLPCVNPDGYLYNQQTNPGGGGLWRKNRRNNGGGIFGVDLNRNYSFQWGFDDVGSSPSPSSETYRGTAPASEPEVAAMQAFISSRDFRTALSTHTYSDLWLYPWGYIPQGPVNQGQYDEISELATVLNGYIVGPAGIVLYLANGVTIDYDHGVHGTLSWTPEIGDSNDGFWPAPSRIVPLAQENEPAFLRTALAAGAYVHETDLAFTDLGDGDGNFEAGETFEVVLTVRNSGRAAASPTVSLASGDPNVTVIASSVPIGAVPAFSSASHSGMPLSFSISSGALGGTEITFATTISYQGYDQTTVHEVRLGDRRRFLVDDLEIDLGWIAGLGSDTATTGLWEFGDPLGTIYNGEPSNPEDDATSAPGVKCYATGNGSTNPGDDDVDNGHTTLITPPLDLSSVSAALLSYSRWYANLSNPDDVFEVSISDDDGETWVPLESVATTQNSWTETSFDLSDFVSLSDKVRLRFVAEDDPNNSLVEAAVDELEIEIFDDPPRLNTYGVPVIGSPLAMHLVGEAGESYLLFASQGTALITFPGVIGPILLDPASLIKLGGGSVPASGLVRIVATIPNSPGLVGQTFYLQGATVGSAIKTTNRTTLTFQ